MPITFSGFVSRQTKLFLMMMNSAIYLAESFTVSISRDFYEHFMNEQVGVINCPLIDSRDSGWLMLAEKPLQAVDVAVQNA